jgi:spermidine/putrescine transport system substrate-binding protein
MRRLLPLLVSLLLPVAALAKGPELYVFNWSEYMPDRVLQAFQKETGIKVIYATYDSNEAMYAKVKLLKGKGYDLVFPSTYYVDRMRQEGLLQTIKRELVPNFKHLDPQLLDKPYDRQNAYSVPYLWGSSAIGLNTAFVKPETIRSWNDLWRPEFKGKLLLTDDMREVLGLGLIALGYSGNSTDPAQLEAAYEKLRTLMPSVRVFASDSPKQPFLNKEVHIGMIWNGEVYMANQENPNIAYVYPQEGPILWMDSMVIPKSAVNVEAAHRFIDYLLRPEVAKILCEEIGYATPNLAAQQLLDAKLRQNPTVFPEAAVVAKGEFQVDVGPAVLTYQKYWERLKTGH